MSRLTSRKWLLALLSLLSASVLCWFGRIDAGVYATVVVATVGAYMTANWAVDKEYRDATTEEDDEDFP